MVKIYYYKSEGIYDPRDIIYIAKLKKKKINLKWGGSLFKLIQEVILKKKKKREENVRNHM